MTFDRGMDIRSNVVVKTQRKTRQLYSFDVIVIAEVAVGVVT